MGQFQYPNIVCLYLYSSGNTNDIESVYSFLNEVEKYNRLGDIIIQRDFNAYTNTQPNFVEFDNETKRVNLDDSDYHSDTIMSRNNLKRVVAPVMAAPMNIFW